MRPGSLVLMAVALGLVLAVHRRNARTRSRPWWARDYGQMDRGWVKRRIGG